MSSFLLKGGCALYINYIIINYLSFNDFSTWAVLFSVAILLSVADFGAGQYILTNFVSKKMSRTAKIRVFSNSFVLIVMICLFLTVICATTYWLIDVNISLTLIAALYLLIILRVLVIPHGAFLQSKGNYHERKLFEGVTYLFSLVFILYGTSENFSLFQLLIGMNFFISLSSFAVFVRAKTLKSPPIKISSVRFKYLKLVVRGATPYFVNNTAGLLIYGVFITVASMFLMPDNLAKLALLHSIVFTNLYQGYELVFRTLQTHLNSPDIFKRLFILVSVSCVVWLVFVFVYGKNLLATFFPEYKFENAEIIIYSVYMFLEYFYLLFMTKVQMAYDLSRLLLKISVFKFISFIIFSVFLILLEPIELLEYLVVLVVFSSILNLVFIFVYRFRNFSLIVSNK